MVGDGHAMSVAAQILQHVFGTAEGRFCVDHPFFSEQQSQPGRKGFGLGERCQSSREVQLAVLENAVPGSQKRAVERVAGVLDLVGPAVPGQQSMALRPN